MKDVSYWDAEHCALRLPNGEYCSTLINKSKKVAPFCSVFHRHEYKRQRCREDEDRLVGHCALPGELVDNAGRVCLVVKVETKEAYDEKRPKGHRYKTGEFQTLFVARCGACVEYPKAVKATAITCLACIAAYSSAPAPWEQGYIDSLRKGP